MQKMNIKNMSPSRLSEQIARMKEKPHRVTQIMNWLYHRGAEDFSSMTNLSKALRQKLSEKFFISSLDPEDKSESRIDQSVKYLLLAEDNSPIEMVIMKNGGYHTICISSQVGCPLRCRFCRTGASGFKRNLRCDEILNQILFFKSNFLEEGRRYNVVFMGMGEPLLNIENVKRALQIINAIPGLALGEKRVTLSTIGYPDKIKELAGSGLKFGLAVSLNATTNTARRMIMPHCADIHQTLESAENFAVEKGGRVTLEYVLLNEINDSPEDAERLSHLTAGKPFKINLIPFNEWPGCELRKPSESRIDRFIRILLPRAPAVTVRRSMGGDINAACGQLSIRNRENRQE